MVVDPGKIKVVIEWLIHKDKMVMRNYLGLASYYKQFVNNFAQMAMPSTKLLKGKSSSQNILWTSRCQENFEALKKD